MGSLQTSNENNEPPVWLVVVGLGSKSWDRGAQRLGKQAKDSQLFSNVIILNEKSLRVMISEMYTDHGKFITENRRGHGYWLWKPWILHHILKNELPDGHTLVYLDGGCELNLTVSSVSRFSEYLLLTQLDGLLAFQLNDKLADWCKMDLLVETRLIDRARDIKVVQAGVIMLAKTVQNEQMLAQWKNLAFKNSYRFLDDSPSEKANQRGFIEHRHDQAIWTVLMANRGYQGKPNETAFDFGWRSQPNDFPIWAARNASRFSYAGSRPSRLTAASLFQIRRIRNVVRRRIHKKAFTFSLRNPS